MKNAMLPPVRTARRFSPRRQTVTEASTTNASRTTKALCANTIHGLGGPTASATSSPRNGTSRKPVISRKFRAGGIAKLIPSVIVRIANASAASHSRPARR